MPKQAHGSRDQPRRECHQLLAAAGQAASWSPAACSQRGKNIEGLSYDDLVSAQVCAGLHSHPWVWGLGFVRVRGGRRAKVKLHTRLPAGEGTRQPEPACSHPRPTMIWHEVGYTCITRKNAGASGPGYVMALYCIDSRRQTPACCNPIRPTHGRPHPGC